MNKEPEEVTDDEQADVSFSQEWQQLQSDWQSYQPDIVKIKKRIQWVTWRMVGVLVLDVAVLVSYIPFLLFFILLEDSSLASKIWHVGMLPLLVYGVYWDFKLRLPLFKLEDESTKKILSFYMKRVKAGIKLGDVGFKFCLFLIALFILWVGAGFLFDLGEEKITELHFIVFGLVWIGAFAGIMYWYRHKKLKEAKHLSELWKDFLE
jgi:hypothetical protein